MRLAWMTDVHLNFLEPTRVFSIGKELAALKPEVEGLVLTGDIAESASLLPLLRLLHSQLKKPVFFVLGNHDFYGGSFDFRDSLFKLAPENLHYLTTLDFVSISKEWALLGDDGWYDGRSGNLDSSRVEISDVLYIKDLIGLRPFDFKLKIQQLAREATERVEPKLRAALAKHKKVLFATHVPPFPKAAWHQGQMSDVHWLPFMSSITMGKMLVDVMAEHPEHELLVLCGHTHGGGEYRPIKNVRILTGETEYRFPRLNGVFELD